MEEVLHEAEDGRAAAPAERKRVGQAGEGVPPQAEGDVEAEERPGHLEGEVADGAPGRPGRAAHDCSQPKKPGRPTKGSGSSIVLAEQGAGEAALPAADAAGAAQGEGEDGQAEEGDGQDDARTMVTPTKARPTHGQPAANQVEGELARAAG